MNKGYSSAHTKCEKVRPPRRLTIEATMQL